MIMRWSRPIRLSLLELQSLDLCGETTHTCEDDHVGSKGPLSTALSL
jgi:hypothetical protein